MSFTHSEEIADSISFVRRHAPYSVIDNAKDILANGCLLGVLKNGSKISGTVKVDDQSIDKIEITIVPPFGVSAHCTCSDDTQMEEQWCQHAVALFLHSVNNELIRLPRTKVESTFQMNTSGFSDIANVLLELGDDVEDRKLFKSNMNLHFTLFFGDNGCYISAKSKMGGINPFNLEEISNQSARPLDRAILCYLNDEGIWDDTRDSWFLSSSENLRYVFTLLSEYPVFNHPNEDKLRFDTLSVEARIHVKWLPASVELILLWIAPEGEELPSSSHIIGDGQKWVLMRDTIYPLSDRAIKLASLFPHSPQIILPRTEAGPLLELLNSDTIRPYIHVTNPKKQPQTERGVPKPILKVQLVDRQQEHFSKAESTTILATVIFEYNSSKTNKNLFILRDRRQEQIFLSQLETIGFKRRSQNSLSYIIEGDKALDFIYKPDKAIPSSWTILGISAILKKIRFSKLSLDVDITKPKENSDIDWFDCKITLARDNVPITFNTLFKIVRDEKSSWIRLDNGALARIPGGSLFQLKSILGSLDPQFRLGSTNKLRLSIQQSLSLAQLEDSDFFLKLDKNLSSLIARLKDFKKIKVQKQPAKFIGTVRPYQLQGMSWLQFLREFHLGGILADEMGLGKTIQALALLLSIYNDSPKHKRKLPPSLVVAPTSVITNWLYEARRFTPGLKTIILHGPKRKRFFTKLNEANLVITSYALLRTDRNELEKQKFHYVILDEAQNIKNPQAATTKAAKGLRSDHRIALTGTPTENRPLELWSIMDFLMPGYLGSAEFFRLHIEKPLLESSAPEHLVKYLNGKTKPFLLRRTKAEVEKDLPPKIESELYVDMTPIQQAIYSQILNEVRPKIFDSVRKKGIGASAVSILAALLRLRQVCNHPLSINAFADLENCDSGKFNLLKDLVEEAIANGHKILLYSQFRAMLGLMRSWIIEKGIKYTYLDGTTKNRQNVVDRFNNDESVRVFLVSLKAGGTGLNLTAANTVIIYDPWWNPAVEAQAIDRAHRIGQTRVVSVYRIITTNSIEEKIMALKSRKSKLVDALVTESGLTSIDLTKEDLENLFAPLPREF